MSPGSAPGGFAGSWIQPLLAQSGSGLDTDGDGLKDAQEIVLGTSIHLADTDGDSFTDLEELARGSEPRIFESIPQTTGMAVGMTARGEDGEFVLSAAIYIESGSVVDKIYRLGSLQNGTIISIPSLYLASRAEIGEIQLAVGSIITVEYPLHPGVIPEGVMSSWFLAVGTVGVHHYQAAAVVDIRRTNGVPLLRQKRERYSAAAFSYQGSSSIYTPIPAGGSGQIPADWTPGQICYRKTETVGIQGPVLIQEIIQSHCILDFDAYCEAGCPNALGYLYETIDPVALIGG